MPSGPSGGFEPVPRPKVVNLRLVMDHSLTKSELEEYNALPADGALERARSLKTLHLEWQNIGEIANLDPFEEAEVLFMQFNQIERIEGLECLPKLQFLALQGNQIARVENLLCLSALEFLDLSKNQIAVLDERELPETINMLNLKENPCAEAACYHERLLERLPDLAYLDGQDLSAEQGAAGADGDLVELEGAQTLEPLASGEKGLAAYWRKDELQSSAEASVAEKIQAYSIEAVAHVDDLGSRVEEAADRSRLRREKLSEASLNSSLRGGRLASMLQAGAEERRDGEPAGDAGRTAEGEEL